MPAWSGGGAAKLAAQISAGSPLATAIATAVVVLVGCFVMGTAAAVSAPGWLVVGGLFAPAAVFVIIFTVARLSWRTR